MLPAQGELVFIAYVELALNQQLRRMGTDRHIADLIGLDRLHRSRAELLDGRLIGTAHHIGVVLVSAIEDLQRDFVVAVGLALDLE
ncbi:hypothetical protein D3C72_2320600 [compost metagenome]